MIEANGITIKDKKIVREVIAPNMPKNSHQRCQLDQIMQETV